MIKKILLIAALLVLSVFTANLYAESLTDIKTDSLQKPEKEQWGRDPFIKYDDILLKDSLTSTGLSTGLKVEGIISDGKKALAIINGGFYRRNDKVDDFLIIDIEKDKIILGKEGKTFNVGIAKFAIERTPKGGDKNDKK